MQLFEQIIAWKRLVRSGGVGLLVVFGAIGHLMGGDTISSLQLVSADAAVCIEIPQLDQTWSVMESSPLTQRLLALPPSKRFLQSSSFEQWEQLEEEVTRAMGDRLGNQIRSLFARSMVMAVYLPSDEEPQGVLIGEAQDAKAINSALITWNSLEPEAVMTTKMHRDYRYRQRKRRASDTQSLYLASSDRWFAISDQESRILDVIDRFVVLAKMAPEAPVAASIDQLPAFSRNRQRLNPHAAAYVHINPRAWDRSFDEAAAKANYPERLTNIWKHISTISVAINLEKGLICDSIFEPAVERFPKNWSKLVDTFTSLPSWKERVPDNALFAYWFQGQAYNHPGTAEATPSRLTNHSQRYYPEATQLIWLDLVQLRKKDLVHDRKLADILAMALGADAGELQKNIEKLGPLAELFDSLFLAARVEPDFVRFTCGGGLDSK